MFSNLKEMVENIRLKLNLKVFQMNFSSSNKEFETKKLESENYNSSILVLSKPIQ